MESLIVNLTDNALHATEPGGYIILKAYKESGKKILEVADNGRGIPQEEMGKITEAFYMVDKSRSRQEGGAGLGLALCVKNRRSSWRQTGHHKPAWNRNESKSNI